MLNQVIKCISDFFPCESIIIWAHIGSFFSDLSFNISSVMSDYAASKLGMHCLPMSRLV